MPKAALWSQLEYRRSKRRYISSRVDSDAAASPLTQSLLAAGLEVAAASGQHRGQSTKGASAATAVAGSTNSATNAVATAPLIPPVSVQRADRGARREPVGHGERMSSSTARAAR